MIGRGKGCESLDTVRGQIKNAFHGVVVFMDEKLARGTSLKFAVDAKVLNFD